MKVSLQTTKFAGNLNLKSNSKALNQNQSNSIQMAGLPKYDSVGRSMVAFKGTIDVEALKKAKQDLTRQRDEAQAKLNREANYNQSRSYQNAMDNAEAEIKRKGLGFFNPFKKRDIRNSWENKYYEEKWEIDKIREMKPALQSIVNTCNAALKSKDSEINLGEILNNTQEAQNAINNMLNGRGGLEDRIAGYGMEKSKITRMLINPINNAKTDPNVKVPSAIMLYGATGTGKTTFLDAVAEQSGDIRIDNMTDETDSNALVRDFQKRLKVARDKYLASGVRTLLLINEAEKILAMTPEYAREHLEYPLTESDMAQLETYNGYTELAKNVNHFKGFFDHCSQVPNNDKDESRGALTVFITTNYPHLIHPDLLTRDGKLPYIALYPASGSNIEAVIKHYTRLNSQALEAMKTLKDDKSIDLLSGISQEAKEILKQYKKEGKLGELSINIDSIPYDKISEFYKPSKAQGAFSNDRYRKISEDAFVKYLENPDRPYNTHFLNVLMREKRDIGPKRYAEFQKIYRIMEPIEIGEREEMIKQEKFGTLDEKYEGRLGYVRMMENSEKETILAKRQLGQMTKEEEERLAQIERYQYLDGLSFEEYTEEMNKANNIDDEN